MEKMIKLIGRNIKKQGEVYVALDKSYQPALEVLDDWCNTCNRSIDTHAAISWTLLR